jgi:hypothetical protein
MRSSTLKDTIESHFRFLFDDFSCSITTECYDQTMGNAVVNFTNQYVCIEIVKDRGDILVSLGAPTISRWEWGEFADIIRFLSGNPEMVVYVLPAQDPNQTDESQIARIALLMRKYCEPIFSGSITVRQLLAEMQSKRRQETREFLNKFINGSSQEQTDTSH